MSYDTTGFGFIPGPLKYTNKYIGVADIHYVTAKQKVLVKRKNCNDEGNPFIATLHNVIFTQDICNKLFSNITLMNLGQLFFTKNFAQCTSEI